MKYYGKQQKKNKKPLKPGIPNIKPRPAMTLRTTHKTHLSKPDTGKRNKRKPMINKFMTALGTDELTLHNNK